MCRKFNSPKDILDEVRVTTLLATIKHEDYPPTSNATRFYLSRTFCQAAKWVHAILSLHSDIPSSVASGGFKEEQGRLVPIMVTLEPMSDTVQEMVTCNCQGNCQSGHCCCKKKN